MRGRPRIAKVNPLRPRTQSAQRQQQHHRA